jgi:hypothetical protein
MIQTYVSQRRKGLSVDETREDPIFKGLITNWFGSVEDLPNSAVTVLASSEELSNFHSEILAKPVCSIESRVN